MTIGTILFTWLRGEFVGKDDQGNRYFQEKKSVPGRRRRRWVIYNGVAEASRVPPEWHIWLHYTTDTPPTGAAARRRWEKPHVPNLTGTPGADRPPGHTLGGGKRSKATGDYEAWTPS